MIKLNKDDTIEIGKSKLKISRIGKKGMALTFTEGPYLGSSIRIKNKDECKLGNGKDMDETFAKDTSVPDFHSKIVRKDD